MYRPDLIVCSANPFSYQSHVDNDDIYYTSYYAIETIGLSDNYVPQLSVEFNYELSWLFTNRYMIITKLLRRIWLFSANKIKSFESCSKQPTQLIVELNLLVRHIIFTFALATSYWIFSDKEVRHT